MIIIKENNKYSKSDWCSKLNIDQSDFDYLLENGVLKLDIRSNEKLYRNRFVGFIAISDNIVFSQPKFIDVLEGFNYQYLLSIFNQYLNRKDKNTTVKNYDYYGLSMSNYKETLFEYNLYISLLNYYQTYGIYSVEAQSYNENNSNRISWNRTVSTSTPIHSQDSVFYHNPIGINIYSDDNTVSSIQVSILEYLDQKYSIGTKVINSYDLEKYPKISISDLKANVSTWRGMIQNELSKTYLQSHLHLLNLLSLFIYNDTCMYEKNKKSLYGTISFHNIWEDACAQVFSSQYDTLKSLISQPVWTFPSISKEVEAVGQIPDIIHENESHIFILDAKYYYPLPDRLCGWGDIVKQYFYAKSMKNSDDKQVINTLLFPETKVEKMNFFGTIDMKRDTCIDALFPSILVYQINPFFLLGHYINNDEMPELLSFFTME